MPHPHQVDTLAEFSFAPPQGLCLPMSLRDDGVASLNPHPRGSGGQGLHGGLSEEEQGIYEGQRFLGRQLGIQPQPPAQPLDVSKVFLQSFSVSLRLDRGLVERTVVGGYTKLRTISEKPGQRSRLDTLDVAEDCTEPCRERPPGIQQLTHLSERIRGLQRHMQQVLITRHLGYARYLLQPSPQPPGAVGYWRPTLSANLH